MNALPMHASFNEMMPAKELSILRQNLELLIADLMPLQGFQLQHFRAITGFLQKHNQVSVIRHEF